MSGQKEGRPTKIGVFQNWGMGDLIMTLPVLSELRRLHPQARLYLIVRGKAQVALLLDSVLVDEILELPPNSDRLGMLGFFWSLRRLKLDAVFLGARITPVAALLLRVISGIPIVIGDGGRMRGAYTHHHAIDPGRHRVDQMLMTLSVWTGHVVSSPVFRLPIADAGRAEGKKILSECGLGPGTFIAFHPGGSRGGGQDKRLPPSVVAATIALLREQGREVRAVILFGPDDEDLLQRFEPAQEGVTHISGVSLEVTKYILSQARGFVGSDSGLGHIAAAYGVSTITIAGPTNPVETRPYGTASTVVRSLEEFTCRPCWFTDLRGRCPYDARCMKTVRATQVTEAFGRVKPDDLVTIHTQSQ